MRDHAELRDTSKVLYKSLNNFELTRGMLEERLIAYETTRCYESAQEGNFDGIAWMISDGCQGFYEMADDQLLNEWGDAEDGFMSCWEQGRLVFDIAKEDPLNDSKND